MFTRKDRKIKNLETKVLNRDILIEDLKSKETLQKQENLALHEENKDLRFENEEQREFISRIERLVNSNKYNNANKYNNEKAILSKLKELVSDYQSLN